MKPKSKSKFADMFVEIVDESAIYDAENYDGCKTINAIYRLHDKLIELNKRTEVEC